MNVLPASKRTFSWRDDLTASRDVSEQNKTGYEITLTWYERWRRSKQLRPGRESARRFWREQILSKERKQWQLDQWAEAIRWFLQWLSFCEKHGGNSLSLAERAHQATHLSGARRGFAMETRNTYAGHAGRYAHWIESGEISKFEPDFDRSQPVAQAILNPANARLFLTWLVTDRKIAYSSQKQALNALAYFFREVCGREEVDLEIGPIHQSSRHDEFFGLGFLRFAEMVCKLGVFIQLLRSHLVTMPASLLGDALHLNKSTSAIIPI